MYSVIKKHCLQIGAIGKQRVKDTNTNHDFSIYKWYYSGRNQFWRWWILSDNKRKCEYLSLVLFSFQKSISFNESEFVLWKLTTFNLLRDSIRSTFKGLLLRCIVYTLVKGFHRLAKRITYHRSVLKYKSK